MAADGQQPIAEATDDGKQEEPTLDVAAALASIYHLVGRAHHKLTVAPIDVDDAAESLKQARDRLAAMTTAFDDAGLTVAIGADGVSVDLHGWRDAPRGLAGRREGSTRLDRHDGEPGV